MNINGNDLRKGDVIIYENKLYVCLSAEHRTPGNLRAFMQARLRGVKDGLQKDCKFTASERVEKVDLFVNDMQFLYRDGEVFHFMNVKTYEQVEISSDFIGDNDVFLQDGMTVEMTFYEETPIGLKLPQNMEFDIIEAEPEIKGATATAAYKAAKLSNGVDIKVPPFVKVGDRIKIKTETREYVERVKK